MIRITHETRMLLRLAGATDGDRMSDGSWVISLTPETMDRLAESRLPGEPIDQVLQRITRAYLGREEN